MDISSYLRSITEECDALKNRVRNFISDGHWPTDGAWKESVLRAIISRTLPSNYSVASGFVITDAMASTQIDILIYDNRVPVLYKGGDLVFVPPSACAGIIEVKARLNASGFRLAANKLADTCELVFQYEPERRLFSGIFAYDIDGSPRRMLQYLDDVAGGEVGRIVNHVSIGSSTFIKYWRTEPESGQADYKNWHQYSLDRMAPGYFVHNLMSFLSDDDLIRANNIWFPREGKEVQCVGRKRFTLQPVAAEQPAPPGGVDVEAAQQ